MKKKVSVFISLVVIILAILYAFLFTGLIGKPVFIRMPLSASKIVRLSSISEIYVDSNKNNIKNAEVALKYNSKINSLHLVGEKIDNIDFIPDNNEITELVSECQIEDWNQIKKCKNINLLILVKSNFKDLNLLKSMNKMTVFEIESSELIKYCDFKCFENLVHVSLNVPNVDMGLISSAPKIEFLMIDNANELLNYEKIKSLSSLKTLNIINSDVDVELIEILVSMELENFYISGCNLHGDEESINKLLDNLKCNDFIVEYNGDLISAKSQ